MVRQRDARAIRADALRMGIKKARSGCTPCMHGYFDLARQHGATEEEIQQAQLEAAQPEKSGLGRRTMMKLAAVGAVGGLAFGSMELLSSKAQIPAWFGTDSGSQSCCDMPQNFYVGRMGYGAEPIGDAYYFNRNAATIAGYQHTYGYWGVVGPDARPAGMSPYAWGQHQADNAWYARSHGPNADLIGGLTVFADVEPGFGGWTFGNYSNNQNVVDGFLTELFNITPPNTWPGLYISPFYWTNLVNQSFRPAADFILWATGCHTCGSDICSPCNFSCNTQVTVQNMLASTVVNITLGGRKPVLWQYWVSDCGCGDYNVATQNVPSFTPQFGAATYFSPC